MATARTSLLVLLLAAACAPEQLPGPILEGLEPAQGLAAVEVPILLRGQHFYLAGQQLLRGDESLQIEDSFRAWLDGPVDGARRSVALVDVEFVDTESLRALVPAGIPVGEYAVVLVAPFGQDGLESGYQALASTGPFDGGTDDGGTADGGTDDGGTDDGGTDDGGADDGGTDDGATADGAMPDGAMPDAMLADAGGVPNPSGGIDPAWIDAAAAAGDLTGAVIIDTDLGLIDGVSWPHFHVVPRQDCAGWPVEIAVFAFTTLHVQPGATVRVRGGRALALIARGAVTIEGVINLTGGVDACTTALVDPNVPGLPDDPGNWCAGPGGYAGGRADNPGLTGDGPGGGGGGIGGQAQLPPVDESGGGGGGHGGLGGRGGDALASGAGDTLQQGGAGGATYDGLVPLCGGSGGGGGGAGYNWDPTDHFGAAGGGGGGAIQIFSRVTISVLGAGGGINAGGGGGGGDLIGGFDDGGGGGGSGGTILLEAPTVLLDNRAVLAANGGGGGGSSSGSPGEQGETGHLDGARTPAGTGGGLGGAGMVIDGNDGIGRDDGAGGGGGGGGRVHVNTWGGVNFTSAGTESPRATQGAL